MYQGPLPPPVKGSGRDLLATLDPEALAPSEAEGQGRE